MVNKPQDDINHIYLLPAILLLHRAAFHVERRPTASAVQATPDRRLHQRFSPSSTMEYHLVPLHLACRGPVLGAYNDHRTETAAYRAGGGDGFQPCELGKAGQKRWSWLTAEVYIDRQTEDLSR